MANGKPVMDQIWKLYSLPNITVKYKVFAMALCMILVDAGPPKVASYMIEKGLIEKLELSEKGIPLETQLECISLCISISNDLAMGIWKNERMITKIITACFESTNKEVQVCWFWIIKIKTDWILVRS